MKNFCLLLISFLFIGVELTNAQYVTIPDANFAAYLNTVIPSAMSGNQLDTTNAAVPALTRIDVENMGILDLTGVQYFRNLITLDCGNGSPSANPNMITYIPLLAVTLDTLICGYNRITSLPVLPGGLGLLKCYENQLDSLPILPSALTYLDCGSNLLLDLPALPSTLVTLDCFNNQLTSLPALPAGLTGFDCSYNQLDSIPNLPVGLLGLDCSANRLVSLPVLSNTITTIFCDHNQLTSLPALPSGLTEFFCEYNQLTGLPSLPAGLESFDCYNNQLTNLPALPAGLGGLNCKYNLLTTLPALPDNLVQLICNNNNISCFPIFPHNFLTDSTLFDISANPFTCLPNYVPAMTSGILAYPLCLPGNPNGCNTAFGIVGYTYHDMNNDCIRDAGDSNLVNIPLQIYDASNNLLAQTYSAINGVYGFADTGATYKVVVDTAGMPFVAQCAYPGLDSLVTLTNLDTAINFSLTCKPGLDVGVQSVVTTGLIFPGMQHDLSVVAGDMSQWYNLNCANGDSGTVQITVSGPVTYVGPGAGALTPTAVSGNIFKYSIANFSAIHNTTAFNLLFKTDTNAHAGDTICVYVEVTPYADNNPTNNTYNYCYTVINSHDPNNKTVYPVDVKPDYNGWFTYTIHFQNTGNAVASNILLADTLDPNLDLKTFQLINYSYKNTASLIGNVLTVRFNNINLPDSLVNPKGSIGFIQYRIKPKAGLPFGTIIKNTGYIYFDFNAPVITDTTLNSFTIPTSVDNIVANFSCKVFPNPSNGIFTVALSYADANSTSQPTIEIYNVLGEIVLNQSLPFVQGNNKVNISNQPAGVYFYRILTGNGGYISTGKMIVE